MMCGPGWARADIAQAVARARAPLTGCCALLRADVAQRRACCDALRARWRRRAPDARRVCVPARQCRPLRWPLWWRVRLTAVALPTPCRPTMPPSKRAPLDAQQATSPEDLREKAAARCLVQAEDTNPPFLLRNPARDKAEGHLRATEKKLVAAEEHANAVVELREKTRGTARAARERLRSAETAYVQVAAATSAADGRPCCVASVLGRVLLLFFRTADRVVPCGRDATRWSGSQRSLVRRASK